MDEPRLLDTYEITQRLKIIPEWTLDRARKTLSRTYEVKDFSAAIRFIEHSAFIAESENHHPDIHLTECRNLRFDLSTHAAGGLTEKDFIVAAKINELDI